MKGRHSLPDPTATGPSAAEEAPNRLEALINLDHSPGYGEAVQVSPLLQRVTAANPSPFTFFGTGTYILGRQRVAVIDPGPDDPGHVAALLQALDRRTVTHICVTHTHSDHSPASRALAAATGAPVLGFGPHPPTDARRGGAAAPTSGSVPSSASGVEVAADTGNAAAMTKMGVATMSADEEPGDWEFAPDAALAHGDVVAGDGWTLECLHTPGHISNHLCFAVPEEHGVLTGDHVMGWASTIIPPPDGDLGDYLRSLQLLVDRGDRDQVYWPTHGPPITTPVRYARALLAHRHHRTTQILGCLRDGPTTIPAMVASMYTTTPRILHRAAERSVLAHLIHLTEQGRVTAEHAADERATEYALA